MDIMLLFSNSVVSDFCDPMDCTMPGSSVLHYLTEFAQIHVHWVVDAIEPSHPLLSLLFCLQWLSYLPNTCFKVKYCKAVFFLYLNELIFKSVFKCKQYLYCIILNILISLSTLFPLYLLSAVNFIDQTIRIMHKHTSSSQVSITTNSNSVGSIY